MQPVICCPLCQDVLSNKMHLQLHLTHLHSVSPDCVEKLLMTVSAPNTDARATQTYWGLVGLFWPRVQVAWGGGWVKSIQWLSSSNDCYPLGKWLKWIAQMQKACGSSLTLTLEKLSQSMSLSAHLKIWPYNIQVSEVLWPLFVM